MTLLELLAVITILAICAGLILCGVQSARAAAARADCQSRLRQIGLGVHSFESAHRHLPEGVWYPFSTNPRVIHAQHAGISWQSNLLPYLSEDALWVRAWAAHQLDPTGISSEHQHVAAVPIRSFRCPTDSRPIGRFDWEPAASQSAPWGLTNYLGLSGTGIHADDGAFHPNLRLTHAAFTDGTSSTLLVGERPTGRSGYGSSWFSGWGTLRYFEGQLMPVDQAWANTPVERTVCQERTVFQAGKYDDPCHHHHFWSSHPGGANFAFADGSVKFLRYSAADILPALATRAGGETVPGEW